MAAQPSFTIAVDSGGTFTDCVAIASDGSVARAKAASTPDDYSRGVIESVRRVSEELGMTLDQLLPRSILFGHGTTVATNTLLTRTGATTGLLTTKGHEDAIVIGRTYQKIAGLNENEIADVAALDKAKPIVPRKLIVGVQERIDARGEVVSPLVLDSVREGIEQLVAEGVDSIAVSLLWSFLNAEHEDAIEELIEREYPQLQVSISHDVAPVIKEYERTATTVMNAYLRRKTEGYLRALHERVAAEGFSSMPVVMQSSGGVLSVDRAKSRPVNLLTSGPAGGVIGAQVLGRLLGYPNVITTDVGGTSFDVGLVVEGEAQFSNVATFDKYELVLPIIDVATIGAGGGSIAWIEPDTGVLRVGPQSAGAEPGPACYGIGGREATVTDANVVLGRINPDYFLGGQRKLDAKAAAAAVQRIADALGLELAATAMGIVDIADAHMSDLVRKVTIERGFDPRDFVLFAFGGAGPTHAASYGPSAGAQLIVVPKLASEFSAFGIAGSDAMVVEEFSKPMFAPFEAAAITTTYDELEARARDELRADGIPDGRIYFQRYVRLRYRGQVHEVETPVPESRIGEAEIAHVLETFERIYETKYGRGTAYRHAGLQAITFRVHGFGRLHTPNLARDEMGGSSAAAALKQERPVFYGEAGRYLPTPVYAAELLRAGSEIPGPAVIEAADTTVVVHPAQKADVDPYLNVVIRGKR